MKMRRPRTLLGMVLVGLAFVTVPLLIAVGNAVVKLGQLAAESAAVLSDSAAATIENQKIATLLLNMERNGRQYVALKDVASASSLLPLYDGDQADFEMRVALLRSLPMSYEISAALEQLATASKEVHRMLHGSPAESSEDAIVERFRSMTTSARDVAQRMRTLIDTRLSSLQENAGAAQRSIAWQSAALIPGTLALIVLFLLLVGRPMRQVDRAIRELGEGDFSRPIAVNGPHDIETLGRQLEWLRHRDRKSTRLNSSH